MEPKKIAIAGPGGNVGSAVIKDLLKSGEFEVTAVIRPTSKYSEAAPSGVKIMTADFADTASLTAALLGQDAVLSLLPGSQTMLWQQQAIIDAAIAAGLKLVFADEFSGNIEGPHYRHFPTSVVGEKLLVREYLVEKEAAKEIAWTALNAGPFFDMWFKGGYAGFDVPNRKAKIYGSGDNVLCWTPIPMVSKVMVHMLRHPEPILNRAVFITGVKGLTQNSMLTVLEGATGEKFEVEQVDIDEIKRNAFEALERGDLRAASMGLTLNYNFNEKERTSDFWHKVENDQMGVNPLTVKDALATLLDLEQLKSNKD